MVLYTCICCLERFQNYFLCQSPVTSVENWYLSPQMVIIYVYIHILQSFDKGWKMNRIFKDKMYSI